MFRFYHLLTYSGLALAVRLFFQTYCNILKNYLFFLAFSSRPFLTESGCKDNAFFLFHPNFLRTFFDFFFKTDNQSMNDRIPNKLRQTMQELRFTDILINYREYFRRPPQKRMQKYYLLHTFKII